MGTNRQTWVLVAVLLTFLCVGQLAAQERSSQQENQQGSQLDDGWQGPRPTMPSPQPSTPFPAPQTPPPSGKQVLEIPSRPQQPLEPPRRQAEIPPRSQPELPIRRQHETSRAPQSVSVTVTSPQGGYIPGLQRNDFTLYEDGVQQEITYFNTGENEPVSLGLIIDTSGSMRSKIDRARQALRRFIDSIRPQDEVFIQEFNQHPSLLQDFTDSRILLMQAVTLLRPNGGTTLYDAILEGLRRVKRGQNQKRALIVITDGLDTSSFASLNQTINAAKRSGVLIYTIGIGDPQGGISSGGGASVAIGPFSVIIGGGGGSDEVDSRTLRQISDETGGEHFLLNPADVMGSTAVLDVAVQTISRELRQQYTLGYSSSLPADRYRSVRVETRRDDVIIRTQKGYAAE
ncbi:MAG: VWA domain-containing protein [Candidatus Binatia bacterium]